MNTKKDLEVLARGVCVSDGRILLCHTKGSENTYLPGGHVEFEESVTTALEREILEELGEGSTAGRFLGAVEHSFIQKGERHCEVNIVFELLVPGIKSSELPASCEDYIEFKWVALAELAGAGLEPAVLVDLIPSWVESGGDQQLWGSNYGT